MGMLLWAEWILWSIIGDSGGLSPRFGGQRQQVTSLLGQPEIWERARQELFWKLLEEFAALEQQIAFYQEKLESLAKTHPECQRLMSIPGIGPITATALIAAVGDVGVFKNGRQFAAWLGLVPKQHSTGGQTRLLGISKRGDSYLRKLLIHGARATLRFAGLKTDGRSRWIQRLLERRGWNRTAVAVANKNARIVWALLSRGGLYQERAS
jgi:transposase